MNGELNPAEVFGEDYLHFYAALLGSERSEAESDLIWTVGPVNQGEKVLDLACGHGRIANRLAERGAVVTGLDLSETFLGLARADAAQRGVRVEYVQGDVADLSWAERFDLVIHWFTSFGYFDDPGNRSVLGAIYRSLRPGGRVLLELNHAPALLAAFRPSVVHEVGDDRMIDEHAFDPDTRRMHTERTTIRGGVTRSFHYSTRIFDFPELAQWLQDAGFQNVEGFGPDGRPLTQDTRRMILRGVR